MRVTERHDQGVVENGQDAGLRVGATGLAGRATRDNYAHKGTGRQEWSEESRGALLWPGDECRLPLGRSLLLLTMTRNEM